MITVQPVPGRDLPTGDPVKNRARALGRLSLSFANANRIAPISFEHGVLTIGLDETVDTLGQAAVELHVRRQSNLRAVHVASEKPGWISEQLRLANVEHTQHRGAYNATELRLVNSLVRVAVAGGSDLYCFPSGDSVSIVGVISGATRELDRVALDDFETSVLQAIVPVCIKSHNPTRSQSGSYRVKHDGVSIGCRMRTYPRSLLVNNEPRTIPVLNFRLHPDEQDLPRLEALGVRAQQIELLRNTIERNHLQALISGLPGSGKTTTVYVFLRDMFMRGHLRLFTLEVPIEVYINGLIQRDLLSIADSAEERKSLLQMAPEAVFVGEALSAEEFKLVVEFLETGLSTITTFHERTAFGAIHRARMMAGARFIHKIGLVWSQALLAPVCQACGVEGPPSNALRDRFAIHGWAIPKATWRRKAFDAGGSACSSCNGIGLSGIRRPIVETIAPSRPLREQLANESVSWEPGELAKEVFNNEWPSLAMQARDALLGRDIDEDEYLAIGDDRAL